MAQLETGIFLFMVAFSFGFMIWASMKNASLMRSILRLVAISMFFGMALFVGSGYEVSATKTIATNSTSVDVIANTTAITGNVTKTVTFSTSEKFLLIPEGTEGGWLSYAFVGFAIMNLVLLVRDVWGND